ncbi:MAG: leucine-rich repeat domain-containing protein, partial [Clostridia bacterium]|nr:leucine-rich repeat domain-containing protein [Clostridia bacterium]
KGTMPSNSTYALEEGTTGIATGAFQGCTGLTSITIPNTVTVIGNGAFNGCTGLTEIVIPNSVTNMGNNVFKNCTNLNSIEFEDSNGWRVSEYDVANGGTLVSVSTTNFAQNATLLKSTYCAYFWKKG